MTAIVTTAHWDSAYRTEGAEGVSWHEARAVRSLAMIGRCGADPDAPIVDAGGGASPLAGELLEAGYRDVSVVDLSAEALARGRAAAGQQADEIAWIVADLRRGPLDRRFAVWHERAVLHFMVEEAERAAYLTSLRGSLLPAAWVVIAGFGPAGPERCSGLPVRRASADALAAELGEGFELVESELCEHRTPGGASQQFVYARFRFAGKAGAAAGEPAVA